MKTIVIGAGNWGTTLSCIFSENQEVSLWTTSDAKAGAINTCRENSTYLKGIPLPDGIHALPKFGESIGHDDLLVIAVPSHQVRSISRELSGVINGQTVMCVSKGFEHTSFKTMSEVIQDELPKTPVVIMTGPNIAREIAEGKPAKAVLASKDLGAVSKVAKTIRNKHLAFEISSDVKGVELCASLKGIIAIGVGIADGLDLGNNFMSLIVTYGLQEFADISGFLGISSKTVYGIAGLGDLIATCLSKDSRNRRFGYMLGKGMDREAALQEVGMVVEGVQMAKTISDLDDLNMPIPLFAAIAKIIFEPNGHLPHTFINCLTQYKNH